MMDRRRQFLWGAAGMASLLLLWFAVARLGWVGRTLLADPHEVLAVFAREADARLPASARLLPHFLATLGRAGIGFGWGMLFGLSLGWAFGARPRLEAAGHMPLELTRAIPPILVFPVLLVAFDYADGAYEATIAFGCAPIVAVSVAAALRRSGGTRFELLEVFGATEATRRWARVRDLLPSLLLAARVALSLSLVISVVTEMVFAPRSGFGLGAYAKDAEMTFDTPGVYAAMLLIGVAGLTLNLALSALAHVLAGEWRGGAGAR